MLTLWAYHFLHKKRVQALSNEKLASVTSLFAVGGYLEEIISGFTYLSSFTGSHVSKAINKFTEMKEVPIGCKVNMTL